MRHCFELTQEQVGLVVGVYQGRPSYQLEAASLAELIACGLLTVGPRGFELTDLGQLVARRLGGRVRLQDVSVLEVAVHDN